MTNEPDICYGLGKEFQKEDAMTPTTHMPPAPHEMMQALFPKLKSLMVGIIPKCRPYLTAANTIENSGVSKIDRVHRYIQTQARAFYYVNGYSEEDAANEANHIGHHCHYLINYEIHHRKMFWVDGVLAEMFHHTQLDIEGDSLRLPFPACAYSFTDGPSLALGKELIDMDDQVSQERTPTIMTAYMISEVGTDGGAGLTAYVLVGCRDDEWPYMVSRSMLIHPHDRLDRILESHTSDVDAATRDPVFTSPTFKKVLHLVFNAILYSTTQDLSAALTSSPVHKLNTRRRRAKGDKLRQLDQTYREARKAYSEDAVFYLPGKIDISHRHPEGDKVPQEHGGPLTYRFMVRGHWRKANPNWKSQRVRWVQPYYKGPKDAPVIEKEYRLKT